MAYVNIFLFIVVTIIIPGKSQLKMKGKQKEITPIEKFSFLVEGDKFVVASTVRLEQMDILIGMDFEETKWRQTLAEFDRVLEAFPQLPFFRESEELMEEYVGLCMIGQSKFTQFHTQLSECLNFKNEQIPDQAVNLCSKEPIGIKDAELLRELQNIKNRFKDIDTNWSVDTVKTSVTAQNILFEFCSYYNDFAIVYSEKSGEMLTAMEELSDGIYPEVLFGELQRDCNYSINGEGESFKVVKCTKTNKGYRCQIEITQATDLKTYTRSHAIHYHDISLMGHEYSDIFARTIDVQELKFLDCNNAYSGDYAVCIEKEIEEPCKTMIGMDDIRGIIMHCNFTKGTPPVGIVMPNGGVLIQGIGLEIANGKTNIPQKPPMVAYSPEIITIKTGEEDYVFPPAIHVEELTIIESKLTKEDVQALMDNYEWEKLWNSMEVDDYISYALVLLQVIIFPLAIIGCYLAISQRKMLMTMRKERKRGKGKENFRQNQYLLKKI